MTTSRDTFLSRVRQALDSAQRVGSSASPEPRGRIGYQGGGPDPVTRFRDELTAAGSQLHLVPDCESAVMRVLELIQARSLRRALVGRGNVVDSLGLPDQLRAVGVEVVVVDELSSGAARDPLFAADVGISGVDYLIAETGSVALLARPGEPRSLSLLPPVHIAVANTSQLLPDLFDLFDAKIWGERPSLPSCVALITGPSKTGDIELRLVTGVHGPGEIHVILIG